ncbi:hypothetical protein P7B02_08950 [Caulobacter segnis]|uniref:hypothetical protein n=1 Tax=Caulobacter segnis TaxID=88688 RepID=UPI00240F8D68|nr:hypothetical protein [Caulobacter segnis]MDG2521670.1 hypothetical protein [Caulobacter segnis]
MASVQPKPLGAKFGAFGDTYAGHGSASVDAARVACASWALVAADPHGATKAEG